MLRLQTLQVVLTDAGFTHRLIADTVSRFTPLADSRAAPSHFCDDTALQPPHFRFNVLIVSFLRVSLGLKLQIPGDQQCHIPLQYQLRRRWVGRPEMTPDAVKDQIAVLRIGWGHTGETVVLLSHKKPDGHINVKVEFGEGEGKVPLDNIAKRAEGYKPKERVTYKMIKEYIEAKYGFKIHTAYIAEVKRDLGLPMYNAPNAVEELKQPRKHPTAEKVEAIKDALKHFEVI